MNLPASYDSWRTQAPPDPQTPSNEQELGEVLAAIDDILTANFRSAVAIPLYKRIESAVFELAAEYEYEREWEPE